MGSAWLKNVPEFTGPFTNPGPFLSSECGNSSHSRFLLQSFVVSIPFPLYLCKILLFFPAPNFFSSSFLSLFPLIGKGGGQEAFCGGTCEPAPVLSAFTWIPH